MTRFDTYEGNVRALPWNLQRSGIKGVWDVSGASSILHELTRPDGTNAAAIPASAGTPGADWANGVVIGIIDGTNVTAIVGTWTYSLTVFIGTEEITALDGVIEVKNRPGFGITA